MEELIGSIFVFLTILLWIDFILSFVSKTFNEFFIDLLIVRSANIDKRRKKTKLLFKKMFNWRNIKRKLERRKIMFTGEIINLVLDDDKEKELDEALEKLSRVIDEACDKYAQEKKLNDKEEMDLPRKKEEQKEKSDDNSIEISVELKNYDEIVRKLEHIKKLLNEINNIHIEVK